MTGEIETSDIRPLTHVLGHDADGLFGRQATVNLRTNASVCPLPSVLGWDVASYPVVPSYRDLGNGVRKGAAGWSPFEQASYLACRNGPQIHVSLAGNDSTGTGTLANPYRTPNKAIQVANAGGVACTIRVAAGLYLRAAGGTVVTVPTVPVCLLATGGTVQLGVIDTYAWTADTTYTNCYKTTRSVAAACYNPAMRDRFGNAVMYQIVNSAAACNVRPGTMFTDNVTVWLNPFDGVAPTDATARLFVKVEGFSFNFGGNPQDFFVDGETTADGWDVQGCRIKIIATACGAENRTIAMRRVANRYAGYASGDASNAFGFDNWRGLIWLEECYAARPAADCFNFHNNLGTQQTYVVTLNCTGLDAGVFGAGSNNGLTTHSNIIGIDIAGDYDYCQGGTLRNIGTTRMLGHGSRYANDRGDLHVSGGLVYPTEVGMLNTAQIWLSECIVEPAAPTHYAANVPAGTTLRLRNMPALRGQIAGGGTVEVWAA